MDENEYSVMQGSRTRDRENCNSNYCHLARFMLRSLASLRLYAHLFVDTNTSDTDVNVCVLVLRSEVKISRLYGTRLEQGSSFFFGSLIHRAPYTHLHPLTHDQSNHLRNHKKMCIVLQQCAHANSDARRKISH